MKNTKEMELALKVFESRRATFAQEHHDEYVVISKEGNVYGFYRDELEAYFAGNTKYGKGEYLLQKCIRQDEEEKVVFHSRVR